MNAEEVQLLLDRTPFTPFRIHLSNGNIIDVKHPELVWLFRTRLEVAIPAQEGSRLLDRSDFISLLHIARIEDIPIAA
jgi:hypothetical protein